MRFTKAFLFLLLFSFVKGKKNQRQENTHLRIYMCRRIEEEEEEEDEEEEEEETVEVDAVVKFPIEGCILRTSSHIAAFSFSRWPLNHQVKEHLNSVKPNQPGETHQQQSLKPAKIHEKLAETFKNALQIELRAGKCDEMNSYPVGSQVIDKTRWKWAKIA